jgi:hypothetical protein
MRATISKFIEALPTLALRISSNRFKVTQISHSETVAGCTALMDAIACLRSLLGALGYRKLPTDTRNRQY